MDLNELKSLTIQFKKTLGYIERSTGDPNCLIFSRGDTEEMVYFYDPNIQVDLSSLSTLAQRYRRIPEETSRFFLSTSPLGRPPSAVAENGFKYQVHVWFFDKEFSKVKEGPLRKLEAEIEKYESERIPQPYKSEGNTGDDILTDIINELREPQNPCLRIILAPAGFGKSVFMAGLYKQLKEEFMVNKQQQRLGLRPLLILPGHIGRASDLDTLINNFINSEYTYGDASVETFKFWVNNNFAIWLIDGVEEVFQKNPEKQIYDLLNEFIYSPNSKTPQIVITMRKQLLAACPELDEYIEEFKDVCKVYDLTEWEVEQKRNYFEKNLTIPQDERNNFMTDISNSPQLSKLCEVPYFCRLILDLKNNNEMQIFQNKCELVEHAVLKYCEREYSKGLDREIFTVENQLVIFTWLAEEALKENEIKIELLTDLAEIITENVEEELRNQQIHYLQRHALITQVGDKINFVHDIINQYFQGRCFVEKLMQVSLEIFEKKEIEYGSFLMDYLLKNIPNILDWGNIVDSVLLSPCGRNEKAVGFRNILKILLHSNPESTNRLLRDILQQKNLIGLRFQDLNMDGFQFQGSNLENVTFENCVLSNANFNGCHFKNTSIKNCQLSGATTRASIFESVILNGRLIDDQKEIVRQFCRMTEIPIDLHLPCQAYVNLKKVLIKIIRKGRGFKMPRNFLLNIRCPQIPAFNIVEELVRYDILKQDGEYLKIKIDIFEPLKQFADGLPATGRVVEIITKITNILNEICPDSRIGCKHLGE